MKDVLGTDLPSDVKEKHIDNLLSKEDKRDFALTCKALRGRLDFMPDSVEAKYDMIARKKIKLSDEDKTVILLACASENDAEGVQWIIRKRNTFIHTMPCSMQNITPAMGAKNNNNDDMGKQLVLYTNNDKNTDWKTTYKNITMPSDWQNLTTPGNEHDFAILPYISSCYLDNHGKLDTLLKQEKITPSGKSRLMSISIHTDAVDCFKLLVNNTKNYDSGFFHLSKALEFNSLDIAEFLLENKDELSININNPTFSNTTLLDDVTWNNRSDSYNKEKLLKKFGAKKLQDIKREEQENKNTITPYSPYCSIQ